MSTSYPQEAEQSLSSAPDDGIYQLAELSASLPTKLYRVQYDSCQTNHDENGLYANDHSRLPSTLPGFARSIENHFTWGCKTSSRYITLFSDEVHARNWASSRSRSTGQLYDLITISTFHLSQSKLFKLSNLVAGLNLEIPDGASQHITGAYLCLHCVPSHAIEKIYVIDGSYTSCVRMTTQLYAGGRLREWAERRLKEQTDIEERYRTWQRNTSSKKIVDE